MKDENQKRVKN